MDVLLTNAEVIAYENNYLNWVRNVAIIVAAAIAASEFLSAKIIAFWLLILGIFLNVSIQVDYLIEREKFINRGLAVPLRLDLLWVGTSILLILTFWMIWRL